MNTNILTLAQLKRDIIVGKTVYLIEYLVKDSKEKEFRNLDIKSQIKKRIISQTRQTSFALGTDCNEKKINSWSEYPNQKMFNILKTVLLSFLLEIKTEKYFKKEFIELKHKN